MLQSAKKELRLRHHQLNAMTKVRWKRLQGQLPSDTFLARSTSRILKEAMLVAFARQRASILQLNSFAPSIVADNKIQSLTKMLHLAATPS